MMYADCKQTAGRCNTVGGNARPLFGVLAAQATAGLLLETCTLHNTLKSCQKLGRDNTWQQ
jgi:hypothetical protein